MGWFNGPKITMTIPQRNLTFDEVQNRFRKQLLQRLKDTFSEVQITNLRQKWESDFTGIFSCEINGHGVTATMKFEPNQVPIEVQLPLGAGTQIDIESTQQTLEASLTKMLS